MEEGEASSGVRVLVNNQNTQFATVTIPTFSAGRVQGLQRDNAGGEINSAVKQLIPGNAKEPNRSVTGDGTGKPVGILRSEMHPHLDDVYQRVMRRLQWRANYEEIGAPFLAVQYGIVDDVRVEERQVKNLESEDHQNSASLISANSMRQNQQQGRGSPRKLPLTKGDDENPDTLFLSQQPCPKTLRLVLNEVMTTVTTKLRVADSGSLKDCLCLVFESRTLLDRLLKEIPVYSHFQGDGERLLTPMQLHDMYQEFRKQPVVLPGSCYLKDETSGRVVAFVDKKLNGVSLSKNYELTTAVPETQHQDGWGDYKEDEPMVSSDALRSYTSRASVILDRPQPGQSSTSRKVSLGQGLSVPIPPTYGKSSRTRKSCVSTRKQGGVAMQSNKFPLSASSSTDFAARGMGRLEVDGDLPLVRPMESPTPESSRVSLSLSKQPQSASERCRRAVQVTSVGVLTEMNNTTVVSREEYENVWKMVKSLQTEIDECKQNMRELQQQLKEEQEYTSQKRRVMQYLRETLYKECNVLRSQLSMAQQKQIQYQNLIKEQQQQNIALAASLEARNAPSSPYNESSRFPSLGVRHVGSEASVMMMHSLVHIPRRANPNHSLFNTTRTTHLEEHDDRNVLNGSTPVTPSRESGGGNMSTTSAAETSKHISVDITAIQSLLDLVLLAVENDEVLPSQISQIKNPNTALFSSIMVSEPHTRERALRKEFDEWQRQIKETYMLSRIQLVSLIERKDKQIARLKSTSDARFMQRYWQERGEALRNDLRRLRNMVNDGLSDFRHFMLTTMQAIVNRARVVDTTLSDNHTLYTTQSALRDVISSARTLLMPMLTTEYGRGYHPWPLRLRNTPDPLHQMMQARYGDGQVMIVREEMNIIGELYVDLHNYVMKHQTVPQMKRPMPGQTLRQLCAALVLSSAASSDLWTKVRKRYENECVFQRNIARLNMKVVALLFRQRIMTERSAEAMRQNGMDPRVMGLPAQRTINKSAEELQNVILERALLRKQRQENAREVYRLWKCQQIDLFEGYASPTQPQRLLITTMGTHTKQFSDTNTINETKRSLFLPSVSQKTFWNRVLSAEEGETQPEARNPSEEEMTPLAEAIFSEGSENFESH